MGLTYPSLELGQDIADHALPDRTSRRQRQRQGSCDNGESSGPVLALVFFDLDDVVQTVALNNDLGLLAGSAGQAMQSDLVNKLPFFCVSVHLKELWLVVLSKTLPFFRIV